MKKGFTLAEVLITLGIIGVVAALTAPALVKNTGSAKIGPSLAKFVNTFETATEQFMNDENVDKLSDSVSNAEKLAENLSKYMIMTPLYIKDSTGDYTYEVDTVTPGHEARYQLKDGSVVLYYWGIQNDTAKGPYKGIIGGVVVDINGNKAGQNNKSGKDVFKFYIDDSGILIPAGSNAEQYVKGSKTNCTLTGSGNYLGGFGCTGRIADNGWKADY